MVAKRLQNNSKIIEIHQLKVAIVNYSYTRQSAIPHIHHTRYNTVAILFLLYQRTYEHTYAHSHKRALSSVIKKFSPNKSTYKHTKSHSKSQISAFVGFFLFIIVLIHFNKLLVLCYATLIMLMSIIIPAAKELLSIWQNTEPQKFLQK